MKIVIPLFETNSTTGGLFALPGNLNNGLLNNYRKSIGSLSKKLPISLGVFSSLTNETPVAKLKDSASSYLFSLFSTSFPKHTPISELLWTLIHSFNWELFTSFSFKCSPSSNCIVITSANKKRRTANDTFENDIFEEQEFGADANKAEDLHSNVVLAN